MVQPALLPDESLLSVGLGWAPDCFRLFFDGRDVAAQTCIGRESTDSRLGGRYFSFTRVDGDLRLWAVGEWSAP